jgi:DHA1 family multidrug resistance protein-like MFS transporter
MHLVMSSGIAGPNSIMSTFDVSQTSALVGLTLFVLGYGLGPMIFSPLSEMPSIGRNRLYIGPLTVFVALQFPTIYARNFNTVLAMRFLAGFFGSPALATGGATLADIFAPQHITYSLGIWGCAAVCGPTLGPLLGGFAFQANGWQWCVDLAGAGKAVDTPD